KVIIDVTNRVDMKDPGKTLDGSSMSEHIQKKAPQAHVVKAFNYAFASKMADPKVDGKRLDGFVAGDDEQAKQKALQFVESIGFRPIDAGDRVEHTARKPEEPDQNLGQLDQPDEQSDEH